MTTEQVDVNELRAYGRQENQMRGSDWHPNVGDLLIAAAAEIERLRSELAEKDGRGEEAGPTSISTTAATEMAETTEIPWPPLMRAAEVNDLWQQGAWNVAVARRNADGAHDWLALNEVCTRAEDDPFLADWPNLLVVAMPWEGIDQAPFPPGAVRYDVDSDDPFDQKMMERFEAERLAKQRAEADPVAGEMFATDYIIDAFGPGHDEFGLFQVRVVWRGRGLWAVQRGGFSQVLNDDDEWEFEASPSNRDDDFLERCRFSFEDAVARAKQAILRMKGPRGMTAEEFKTFLAEEAEKADADS